MDDEGLVGIASGTAPSVVEMGSQEAISRRQIAQSAQQSHAISPTANAHQ
jgi:hypothetical protein